MQYGVSKHDVCDQLKSTIAYSFSDPELSISVTKIICSLSRSTHAPKYLTIFGWSRVFNNRTSVLIRFRSFAGILLNLTTFQATSIPSWVSYARHTSLYAPDPSFFSSWYHGQRQINHSDHVVFENNSRYPNVPALRWNLERLVPRSDMPLGRRRVGSTYSFLRVFRFTGLQFSWVAWHRVSQ